LEEFDSLHALVESFRQYIQRNRLLADSRRNGYYHLFRLTRRLARLRAQIVYSPARRTTQTLAKIRKDIQQTKAIFNRAWLEKKMEELSGEINKNA
jgi:phosphohistidine phosphatase SixA